MRRVLALVVLLASVSCGGDDSAEQASQTEGLYAVGQTARTGDYDVVIHGFQDPWTEDPTVVAQAGNRLISVDLEVTSTTSEPDALQFIDARVTDSAERTYMPSTVDGSKWMDGVNTVAGEPPSLWGELQPNESRQGTVTFELPADATGLRIQVTGNRTANGSLFKLS